MFGTNRRPSAIAKTAGTSTFQFEVHGPPCHNCLRAGIEADSLSIADTRARSCWGAQYKGRELFKRRDNSCSSSSRALQFAQVCRWARIFSASCGSSALAADVIERAFKKNQILDSARSPATPIAHLRYLCAVPYSATPLTPSSFRNSQDS